MNSALLNIWRENGAYLRFADAKNGLLASVAMAILLSYVNFVLISDGSNWFSLPKISTVADLSFADYVVCVCLLVAVLLSGLSIVPTLSKSSLRTSLFLGIARFFGVVSRPVERGVVFFLDVAGFPSKDDYSKRIAECFEGESCNTKINQDLIEQIWIVSKIASAKHFVFLLSIFLVLIALIFSLFS